jgi:hypothetical protein
MGSIEEVQADLTGGLKPEREYVFSEPQTTPGMQDGVNWWIWDDAGEFGLPRVAVEAVAPEWNTHEVLLNFVEPGGKLLRNWSSGQRHPVIGPSGKATHFGAGPLSFNCIEPFRRYRAQYDGDAMSGTFEEMARAAFATERRAPLKFDIELETAVPPWVQGTLSSDAAIRMAKHTVEGQFMGGDRLEQLCRVRGRIEFGGAERNFRGGALRIRRQGVRNISGFWGHCWQSALFPSGKAFGYIAYPPRADGQPSYNEGFIYMGKGPLVAARVVEAPWLTALEFSGEDVSLVLETGDGRRYQIGGKSFGGMPTIGSIESHFPPLFQSIVRYQWGAEEAYGMMERSNLPDKVRLPVAEPA